MSMWAAAWWWWWWETRFVLKNLYILTCGPSKILKTLPYENFRFSTFVTHPQKRKKNHICKIILLWWYFFILCFLFLFYFGLEGHVHLLNFGVLVQVKVNFLGSTCSFQSKEKKKQKNKKMNMLLGNVGIARWFKYPPTYSSFNFWMVSFLCVQTGLAPSS